MSQNQIGISMDFSMDFLTYWIGTLSVWLLSSLRLLLLYAQFAVFHSYLASSIIHTLPGKDSGAKDKRNINTNLNQFEFPASLICLIFRNTPAWINECLNRLWSPWVLPYSVFEAVKTERDTRHNSLQNSRRSRLSNVTLNTIRTPHSGNFSMGVVR